MIQIILATLIDDPHQIVQGRSRIGKDPVDLPWDEGRLIAAVIDTKSEGFSPVLSFIVQIALDLEVSFADPMRFIPV